MTSISAPRRRTRRRSCGRTSNRGRAARSVAAVLVRRGHQRVAGLLGNPGAPFGWAVTPARWTRRVSSSMKHSTCSRRSEMASSVKKSHATIPADDHLLDLLAERRPPRVGPCAGDQAAVPAQQGQGPDQEARPARPRQDTADGGEQGPVGRFELRSWSLAAEHGELVTQDKDLKVLGGVTAGELGEELDGAAQRQIRKSCQHRGGLRGGGQRRRHSSKPRSKRTPQLMGPV